MELNSRNLFIDTRFFLKKSLDFKSKELDSLCQFVKQNLIKVLITDINEREIRKKIKDETKLALSKITVSDARILKSIPEFRKFVESHSENKIETYFLQAFESFKKNCKVEIVSSNEVNVINIFENYCNESPPFRSSDTKNRKGEFPDAFALAAISMWATKFEQKAYLLSGDSDWEMFAKESYNTWPFDDEQKRFTHISELPPLLDMLIRQEENLEDITSFADKLINNNQEKIELFVKERLKDSMFETSSLDTEIDLLETYILYVKMENKDIIAVDRDGASYNIDFEIDCICKANIIDFENSIWDSVDREYAYLEKMKIFFRQKSILSVEIDLSFDDGIASNFQIIACGLPSLIEVDYDGSEYIDIENWALNLPVTLCGVKDGKITADGKHVQNFENIETARKIFPELNIYRTTSNFTKAMGNRITGDLRFETWKASEFYSS